MAKKEDNGVSEKVQRENFARNIRFLRSLGDPVDKSPYSQTELATELGVSRRTIISWESGNLPQISKLQKVARVFSARLEREITPDDLLNSFLRKAFQYIDTLKDGSEEAREITGDILRGMSYMDEDDLRDIQELVRRKKKEKN